MDTAAEPRPGDADFDGFRMRLPEDCVEYMLFVIGDNKAGSPNPSLEIIRKAADQKLSELAKDYIWQRDPFKLETKVQKGLGLPYLHGTTHYGDNVEDEWLIVYMLRELSKSFPNLWIRISDSDGEFLLIEAAKVTPKWISPENDGNRVWIHDGKLLLIPVSSAGSPNSDGTAPSKPLSLPDAISAIRSSPVSSLVHSPLIEAEAFYRLEKYPAHITASSHRALATIPRKLAYILHARPRSVAPATEAFYLRDPRGLKTLLVSSALTFPPTDLVTVSIRFTKVLYAQLKSQHFPPPPAWRSLLQSAEADSAAHPPTSDSEPDADTPAKRLARLDLGMKLTTGFELLARDAHASPSRVVREVGLLLDDLAEDGEEGALPSDEEMRGWEGAGMEDGDEWMDIDFNDFERELDGKGGKREGPGFGDAAAQADLRKMVSRFEAFLNDESAGLEGAEVDEMDRDDDDDEDDDDSDEDGGWEDGSEEDEDQAVSFDEEQFSRMMREMMGLPAEDDGTGGEGGTRKGKQRAGPGQGNQVDEDEEKEEDVEEIRKLMQQMEAELKGHGALELDPKPKSAAPIKEKGEGPSKSGPVELKQDGDDDDEGSDEAVDIDYNLAKNLLESFKSQAGMAGPAGNLLGLMGMSLPRDEADSDDEKHK